MEMLDIKLASNKENKCKPLKKYKSFQGTIKSMQIETSILDSKSNLCVATCGLDRYMRVHSIETSQVLAKVYLKSRLNCLLFSKHEPVKLAASTNSKAAHLDDDQLSNINSEDLGTDDLWSDMETIMDEHPVIAKKRKPEQRLEEFESELSEAEVLNTPQTEFKMPK